MQAVLGTLTVCVNPVTDSNELGSALVEIASISIGMLLPWFVWKVTITLAGTMFTTDFVLSPSLLVTVSSNRYPVSPR